MAEHDEQHHCLTKGFFLLFGTVCESFGGLSQGERGKSPEWGNPLLDPLQVDPSLAIVLLRLTRQEGLLLCSFEPGSGILLHPCEVAGLLPLMKSWMGLTVR